MEQSNQIEGYLFYEPEGEDTLKVNLSVQMKRSQYDEQNMKRIHQKKLIIAIDCGESMHELKKLNALKDAIAKYTQSIIENYTNGVIINLVVLPFDSSNCFFVPYLSQDQLIESLNKLCKPNYGVPNFNLAFNMITKILDNNSPPRDAFVLFITDKTCKDVDLTQDIEQFQQRMRKVSTQTKFLALGCGQEDESLLDQICDIGLVEGAKTTINFNDHLDQDIIQILLSSFVDEETKPQLDILINFFDQYLIVAPLENENLEHLFFSRDEILIKSSIVFNEIVKNQSQPTIQGFKINFILDKVGANQPSDSDKEQSNSNSIKDQSEYNPQDEAEFQKSLKEINNISYGEKVSEINIQIQNLMNVINKNLNEDNKESNNNKKSVQVKNEVLKGINQIKNILDNSQNQQQEFLDPNERLKIKVILDNAKKNHEAQIKDIKKVHPACNVNVMAKMIMRRLLENNLPVFKLIAIGEGVPVLQLIQIQAEHYFLTQGKKLYVREGVYRDKGRPFQMRTYSLNEMKPLYAPKDKKYKPKKPIKSQMKIKEEVDQIKGEIYQINDNSTDEEFKKFIAEFNSLELFEEQKGDQMLFNSSMKQQKVIDDLENNLKAGVRSVRLISKTFATSEKIQRTLDKFLAQKKDKRIAYKTERFRHLENGKNQIVKTFTISFNQ